jgi:hypothetical protein
MTCTTEPVAALRPERIPDLDAQLLDRYTGFAARQTGEPDAIKRVKFLRHILTNDHTWGYIRVGCEEALATRNPRVLHDMLQRYFALTLPVRTVRNAQGIIESSGYDHSGLLDPYVLLLKAQGNDARILAWLPADSAISSVGYEPHVHATNLLLCLLHPDWVEGEIALDRAHHYLTRKAPPNAARQFVDYFLKLLSAAPEEASIALNALSNEFGRSDWGRHRLFSKPVWFAGLAALADHAQPGLAARLRAEVLSPEWQALWQAYEDERAAWALDEPPFRGALSLFNPTPSA